MKNFSVCAMGGGEPPNPLPSVYITDTLSRSTTAADVNICTKCLEMGTWDIVCSPAESRVKPHLKMVNKHIL